MDGAKSPPTTSHAMDQISLETLVHFCGRSRKKKREPKERKQEGRREKRK
jgi:hypothetical protein